MAKYWYNIIFYKWYKTGAAYFCGNVIGHVVASGDLNGTAATTSCCGTRKLKSVDGRDGAEIVGKTVETLSAQVRQRRRRLTAYRAQLNRGPRHTRVSSIQQCIIIVTRVWNYRALARACAMMS